MADALSVQESSAAEQRMIHPLSQAKASAIEANTRIIPAMVIHRLTCG